MSFADMAVESGRASYGLDIFQEIIQSQKPGIVPGLIVFLAWVTKCND
jgi:hypothetical protein